jgi:hypothetical protein
MLIVVTTEDSATRINTSRYIGKATNRATSRDITVAAMAGDATRRY